MEMVATHVKQKSVARKTSGHFSVTMVLTCSVLSCGLDSDESKENRKWDETDI